MTVLWRYGPVAAIGIVIALLWPLPAALEAGDMWQARLVTATLTAVVVAAVSMLRGVHPAAWLAAAGLTAIAAMAALVAHSSARSACIATAPDGREVVIGRTLNPDAEAYGRDNKLLSAEERLFDVAGNVERVWTAGSIASCRFWLGWGGLLALPLLAACVSSLAARGSFRLRAATPNAPALRSGNRTAVGQGTAAPVVYDAFLSYRHGAPDEDYAFGTLEALEAHGLRVAIDVRDFRPNEHFIAEIERCIRESRFVLCIVTARYVASEYTSEEAIISKTIDLGERRRRLVPLVFERVELPVWLHGLSGIDYGPAAAVDPLQRLLALVGRRPSGVS